MLAKYFYLFLLHHFQHRTTILVSLNSLYVIFLFFIFKLYLMVRHHNRWNIKVFSRNFLLWNILLTFIGFLFYRIRMKLMLFILFNLTLFPFKHPSFFAGIFAKLRLIDFLLWTCIIYILTLDSLWLLMDVTGLIDAQCWWSIAIYCAMQTSQFSVSQVFGDNIANCNKLAALPASAESVAIWSLTGSIIICIKMMLDESIFATTGHLFLSVIFDCLEFLKYFDLHL